MTADDYLYTAEERARLRRVRESRSGKRRDPVRRGRRDPASVPARLVRTSAFAPKRKDLNTDSNFEHIYVVPGHSVIRVKGRELGTQHRDMIYNIFRVAKRQRHIEQRPSPEGPVPYRNVQVVTTTWRDLLRASGKTEHVNNIVTMHEVIGEMKQVLFNVYEGDQAALADAVAEKDWDRLARMNPAGGMHSLFEDITWDGLNLDARVTIVFGAWTSAMIERKALVSHNLDVQNALRSNHAKTFWPYIDSMTRHTYIDETMLQTLAGRDIWGPGETKLTRGQFRRDCKNAFEDMVRAGGLKSYRIEITGVGRKKSRRFYYEHAFVEQMELGV